MSFLIDPPLLVAGGAACARAGGGDRARACAATTGVFWAAGAAFYTDRRWTRPVSRLFGSRDGQDFMINSGVLDIGYQPRAAGTHAAALAAFATYPLWFLLGWTLARG
ncbi:MAG TPA: hypothetical protein VD790_00740 [Thermoleophilaceae bacterium]|nr:hypothetical protein [Thermoleophilaceae bacterium]